MTLQLLAFSDVMSAVGSVLLALLILLAMITVHEFGHWAAGKLLHFKITEFAIGFGPALFKHTKKNGEIFSVRALPLGGYCAFAGEDEEAADPDAFNNKKPWRRIIVLFAGAFMNYVLALVLILISFFSFGQLLLMAYRTDGAEYTQTLEVDLNAMSYNENTGLMNVLESLRLQEKLTYAAESSAYGAFLTAVGGLTQDERAGRYLTVYTSVENDKGTFEAENHVYTDKNGAEVICYPSGVGVSAMTIQDGCVVVITYVTY